MSFSLLLKLNKLNVKQKKFFFKYLVNCQAHLKEMLMEAATTGSANNAPATQIRLGTSNYNNGNSSNINFMKGSSSRRSRTTFTTGQVKIIFYFLIKF